MLSRLYLFFTRLFRSDQHATRLHYRSLFEQSNDAVFIIDLNGKHLQVNQRAADMHGYTKEEIIGMSYRDLIPPEIHPKSDAVLQKLLAGERVPPYERIFRRKDGSLLSTEVNVEVVRDPSGNPLYIQSIVRDISERKQAEDALRASEEKLRALVSFQTIYVLRTNLLGYHTYWNTKFEKDYGWLYPQGIDGGYALQSICEIHHHRAIETVEKCIALPGTVFQVELGKPTKDGGIRTTLWEFVCLTDANEQPYEIQCMGIDISERKQTEDALHASEERLRMILEGTQAGTWQWNISTGETQFNERWAEIIGYTLESLSPISIQTWIDFAHPDDLQVSNQLLQKHFAGETPYYQHEARMKHKDGHWVWVWDRGKVMEWTPDGKPLWMFGTHIDISERKQTEERQRALLNALPDLMFRNHRDGTYLDYHAPTIEDLATAPEQLIGKNVRDILPPEVAAQAINYAEQALQTGKEQVYEYTLLLDGQSKHFEARMVAAGRDEVLSIVRNITERKQAQQHELALALEKERVNLLSAFVQNAAHEFRTPLTIIGSSAYLLSLSDDPAYRTQKVEGITTQVNRITNLVDMLLLLTKIESQGVEPLAEVDLHHVLEVVCWKAGNAYDATPKLQREEEANLPPVWGNVEYLTEALRQILDNAYHFTPPDGVITVRAGANTAEIWIEIQDTGAGIAQDKLPHVFETFWRQDESRSTPGFGLGLAIAHQIITHHGGQVSVSSNKGQGTCFRITLPLQEEKEP